jgi:hypothetical protein
MAILLTHFEPFGDNKQLEITVKYCRFDKIWLEITNATILEEKEGAVIRTPILDLLQSTSEFEVAIERLVNRVDWAELYAETVNQ